MFGAVCITHVHYILVEVGVADIVVPITGKLARGL